jgi:glycosyltransferase involved in cell wall biosynthesis
MKIISAHLIETPLVSVVVPSYNRAETVGQTIDSILNQQCCFDFEIVIGDDCSNDGVREVLLDYQKRFPENIILLFHDINIGLGANWASCVKMCRGKYLANCDNDDYWHNVNKLQAQINFLENNPDVGMIHSNYRTLNRTSGELKECVIHDTNYAESIIWTNFTGKFKCCNSSVVYKKSVIDEHVNLDDYIKYQFTLQDWNTWISIANFTEFYCLPLSTTTVGVETESITRPKEYNILIQRFIAEKKMYKYLCDLFPVDLPFDENGYDSYIFSVLLSLAYQRKDYIKAKEFGKEINKKSFKVLCSQHRVLFWIFVLLKRLKNN